MFTDFIEGPVGNGLRSLNEDIKKTKRNLSRIGMFDEDTDNDVITRKFDEGIKRYQRDNDLRIDGVLKPGGETERSLVSRITGFHSDDIFGDQDGEGANNQIGFGGNTSGTVARRESKPQPAQTAINRLANLILAQGQTARTPDFNPDAAKNQDSDLAERARNGEIFSTIPVPPKKPKLEGERRVPAPTTPQPQMEQESPVSLEKIEESDVETQDTPDHPVYDYKQIPEYKKDWYTRIDKNGQSRKKWIEAAKANSNLSEQEKAIYTEIFTAEGAAGTLDRTTRGGITKQAFLDLNDQPYFQQMQEKYGSDVTPHDLSYPDMQGFYKAYFDRYFSGAARGHSRKHPDDARTGSQMFELLDSQFVATATADSVFRHGSGDGVMLVQEAINDTLGKDDDIDSVFGSGTFTNLQNIAKDKALSQKFLENLRIQRDEYNKSHEDLSGDYKRNEYFEFNLY